MLECENACVNVGLSLNIAKTMFMRNELVPDAAFTHDGADISGCSIYVYPCREVNIMNDLDLELSIRKRAAWGAFKIIEGAATKAKTTQHPAPGSPFRYCGPSCFLRDLVMKEG
uniref:Reverse transcriptase domain-containing protein n=1 Tax=Haemonchus contortus TaxID=6289 RepID=A0A7I4YL02_HAECO